MLKKLAAAVIILALLLCGCAGEKQPQSDAESKKAEELRGIWISCYELNFKDKSKDGFCAEIDDMFDKVSSLGFNAVFVHVRSHGDAYYKSDIFPWSAYISGEQGKSPGYDPLEIMIDAAHKRNLRFHAWINPLRVSMDSDVNALSEDNPARKYLTDDDSSNDSFVKVLDGGIYYNPTAAEVRKLIIDGVEEIVSRYNVDGIHMDDYFYPTTDKSFDSAEYAAYRKSAANPVELSEYRRICVNQLVGGIYRLVKSYDGISFGISPQANVYNNYNQLYADVELWCSQEGYVDYIAPQIYFGFEYDMTSKDGQPMAFEQCADYWARLVKCDNIKLYIGLGLYRSGDTVSLDGRDNDEWVKNSDVISRQIKYSRKLDKYSGVIMFSYSSLASNDNQKKEVENFSPLFGSEVE